MINKIPMTVLLPFFRIFTSCTQATRAPSLTEQILPQNQAVESSSPADIESLGNLQDPTTWPTDYDGMNLQEYWFNTDFSSVGRLDQAVAREQDLIFDNFVNESMKNLLLEKNVIELDLTNEQIFDNYLAWGIKNKQVLTISPLRIRNMLGNIGNWLTISYTDEHNLTIMGIKADSQEMRNEQDAKNYRENVKANSGFVQLNVFGVETDILDISFGGVNGYLSSFRLPGLNEETEAIGLLAVYPDYENQQISRYFPVIANLQSVTLQKGDIILTNLGNRYGLMNLQEPVTLNPTGYKNLLSSNQENLLTLQAVLSSLGKPVYLQDCVNIIDYKYGDFYPYNFGVPHTCLLLVP